MSVWDSYPTDYRAAEVCQVLNAVRAGECAALVGLSGAGKSNLMGFMEARIRGRGQPDLVLVDCNRLESGQPGGLLALLGEALGARHILSSLGELEAFVALRLRDMQAFIEMRLSDEDKLRQRGDDVLCLLLDRFDVLNGPGLPGAASLLRVLRDRFKYRLTYVTASRRPLQDRTELAELFYANTFWLGPLSGTDALWSARQYATRRGLDWPDETLRQLSTLSWGYPSLLRAACEAHAAGCALDSAALRDHPAVRRRVGEFWSDQPAPEELRLSRLEGHPWLEQASSPERIDPLALTAAEQRLLDYLRAHAGQVCLKDDLIRAVWPEDVIVSGLRDDSLAQLMHRLREKVGPQWVQTVPGRGYRYKGE